MCSQLKLVQCQGADPLEIFQTLSPIHLLSTVSKCDIFRISKCYLFVLNDQLTRRGDFYVLKLFGALFKYLSMFVRSLDILDLIPSSSYCRQSAFIIVSIYQDLRIPYSYPFLINSSKGSYLISTFILCEILRHASFSG